MAKKDIILSINDAEPGLVAATKKHSRELGRELTGIVIFDKSDKLSNRRSRDISGLFTEISCDFNNRHELQAVLKPYMNRILAATCRQENSIQHFRKVVPLLPYVNTPSESSLLWATEKHLMRDLMYAYNEQLVPKYAYLEDFDESQIKMIAEEFNFPVIIKPNGLAASILVSKCDTKNELSDSLREKFKIINDIYSRDVGRGKPSVLVEEMIEGDMYSTDAYITPDGEIFFLPLIKVVTAHAIGLEGFYSHHFVVPTGLDQSEIAQAEAAAADALKALNLSATTAHIELFNSPGGWKIIEVGPRIGGYREDLYREAYGIDHYYNDLAVRMGLTPKINDEPIAHATSFNIYPEKEGIIESITGMDQLDEIKSLVSAKSHAKPGDLALFASNGGRLIVDGTLSNKDPSQLRKDLNKLRERIKINIK